jgi:transposase-like protein
MARRKLPPDEVVARLVKDEGLTYEQVAERYGCTRQAVYQAMTAIGERSPRGPAVSYREWIPWSGIKVEHNNDLLVRRLRLYARRQLGHPLPPAQSALLDQWLAYMREHNAIVVYDRAVGFRLAPRRKGETGLARPHPVPVG